jgi:hypothetical protein
MLFHSFFTICFLLWNLILAFPSSFFHLSVGWRFLGTLFSQLLASDFSGSSAIHWSLFARSVFIDKDVLQTWFSSPRLLSWTFIASSSWLLIVNY